MGGWTTSSVTNLATLIVARLLYAYNYGNYDQIILTNDSSKLFIGKYNGKMVIVDISGKSEWTTTNVTDLSTFIVAELDFTIISIALSTD